MSLVSFIIAAVIVWIVSGILGFAVLAGTAALALEIVFWVFLGLLLATSFVALVRGRRAFR